MAENTEIEAKILLPQEIFQKLCSDFTVKKVLTKKIITLIPAIDYSKK
ncbi:hypothetical protein SDC49_13010 [Lactobacillus sp. R2/2]|nr:hypothetical protein [Lactobacillus sp. R2/2]